MGYLLGIDIGTSGTKTILCDDTGRILASVSAEYPCDQPKPNWSEQNPAHWWEAAKKTICAVIAKAGVKGTDVSGIGLSGQMHGAVLLDKSAAVLRPAILWNDQRTGAECAQITATIGAKRLIELTSNPALTGFTAPKILWVRNNEPKLYGRVSKVLLPKDYVRFCLTGDFATEVSDASGTLLFDVKNRRWSKEMLHELQIDESFMPACYESPEVSGKVKANVASELGIPAGTPVVGGGGDQAASAVGNGIVKTGVISATLGTSGVVFAFSDTVQTDPQGRVHTFCHAVPGKWHVMGVVLSAGGSFQWFRNNLGEPEKCVAQREGVDPYDVLCREAAEAEPGSEGLFFLPYLTGERTPHANPNAKGGWIGLSARHRKSHLVRSTLEGITYGMKDSLEIIKGMHVAINEIRISGGGAASAFWRQVQADVYGQDVVTTNSNAGGALGVALLAGVGTGAFKSVEQACDSVIRVVDRTKVNAKTAEIYRKYYPIYGVLYRHLKDDFDEIQKLISG
ncbi:MAG TPA: xylulokinase [Planctomycetota bacterium]|nr:xylulokinase [Planctomycetota bacterium]